MEKADGSSGSYNINVNYSSIIENWLPAPTDGYTWQLTDSGETYYSYKEVSTTQGTSGESTGEPQVSPSQALNGSPPVEMENGAPVDEEDPDDTGTSSISFDTAEPKKPEGIPEITEAPDDTENNT